MNAADERLRRAEEFLAVLKVHAADAVREELTAILPVFDATSARTIEFAVDHGGLYASTYFVDRTGRMSMGRPIDDADLEG